MPVNEINSNFIFTDGEVIHIKVNFRVPVKSAFVTDAKVKLKARHALPNNNFEYCFLELHFEEITSLYIKEDFTSENKISDMTLKQLPDGNFYISLHPYNTSNEPNELDNFVIRAKRFSFNLLN